MLTRHQISQTKATDKHTNKHPDTIQVLGTAFNISSLTPSSPTFQEIYNEPLLWQDFKQSCFLFFLQKELEYECFCFTKKSRAFCEQMMLRADVHKQIHNQADDLFFTSHLDLSGSIYINCFYSLQHWLCKPRQNLNQTHAATSLTAQTQHSAGRRLLEMCLLHRPTRNALGFTGAHIKAQTEQSQLLRDNKERVLLGEPPPVKKMPSPRLKGQGTATSL